GDKSYSYDWAQPVGSIFAIMADVVQGIKNDDLSATERFSNGFVSAVENGGRVLLNALSTGGNVLFEQSFLQGIAELFADGDVVGGIVSAGLNAPTQFISTSVSQIAQMSDPYARTTYVYGDQLATMVNKIKAKIPGLRDELAPVVDVLGHDVLAYGGDNSWYNVMLNPTNVYSKTATEAAQEIYRVYEETGDQSVVPRVAPYYIEYKDARYTFTPHERAEYQRVMGSTNEKIVAELAKCKGYSQLDDTKKATVLKIVADYATAWAKNTYLSGKNVKYEDMDDWMVLAAEGSAHGVSEAEFILAKAAIKGINKGLPDKNNPGQSIDLSKSNLLMEAIYEIPGLSDKEYVYLFRSLGVAESAIYTKYHALRNRACVAKELEEMRKQAGM
ncbi:MAG: hypothetical protein IIX02_02870, partial [Clostridia bacterium]|nr:hypothetical protein [Clostridia bacterium]